MDAEERVFLSSLQASDIKHALCSNNRPKLHVLLLTAVQEHIHIKGVTCNFEVRVPEGLVQSMHTPCYCVSLYQ